MTFVELSPSVHIMINHTLETTQVAVASIGCGKAFAAAVIEGDYAAATDWADFAMVHAGLDSRAMWCDSDIQRQGTAGWMA